MIEATEYPLSPSTRTSLQDSILDMTLTSSDSSLSSSSSKEDVRLKRLNGDSSSTSNTGVARFKAIRSSESESSSSSTTGLERKMDEISCSLSKGFLVRSLASQVSQDELLIDWIGAVLVEGVILLLPGFAGVVLTLRSPSGLLVANLSPRISLERRDKLNGKVDDDMMRSCFVRPFFFARNCEGTFHSLPCQSGLPLYRYIYFDKNSRWKTKPLVTLHMVCISKLRSFC